jgi:hypothetical protein
MTGTEMTVEEYRRKKMRAFIDAASPDNLTDLLDAAEKVVIQFGPDYPSGIVAELVAAVSRITMTFGVEIEEGAEVSLENVRADVGKGLGYEIVEGVSVVMHAPDGTIETLQPGESFGPHPDKSPIWQVNDIVEGTDRELWERVWRNLLDSFDEYTQDSFEEAQELLALLSELRHRMFLADKA